METSLVCGFCTPLFYHTLRYFTNYKSRLLSCLEDHPLGRLHLAQTYSHAVIGTLVGSIVAHPLTGTTNQLLAVGVCVAGAVAPDLVMMPTFAIHQLLRLPGPVPQGPMLMVLKHLRHHVLPWLALAILGFETQWQWHGVALSMLFCVCGINGLLHIGVDVFTHGDTQFNQKDAFYFWPLQQRPFNFGTLDYRRTEGLRWPKPWELAANLVLLAGIVFIWTAG